MAHSKASLFASDEQLFADYCKALAHPARYRIIRLLANRGPLVFGEIARAIPLSNTTLEHHFIRLQRVRLIELGPRGSGEIAYRLVPEVYKEMREMLRME